MRAYWRSGELFVWTTAFGVAVGLLMIAGLLALIMIHGLGQFWPQTIEQVELDNGQVVIGQTVDRETIPRSVSQDQPRAYPALVFGWAIAMCSGPGLPMG